MPTGERRPEVLYSNGNNAMLRSLVFAAAFLPMISARGAELLTPRDRVLWNDSKVIGSPDPPPLYRTRRVFEQLELYEPLFIAPEPGTNSYLIAEQVWSKRPGGLKRFVNQPDVTTAELLIAPARTLYSFCFHPKFTDNGYMYLMTNGPYSEPDHRQNRITRHTIARTPPHQPDVAAELVILEWESNGHDGGGIGFGPDGMLYCSTGDGTVGYDTLVTGQGIDDLLAVVVRIDVDHPDPGKTYSVPKDNPFTDTPGARPEIWAFGFRNPWRMTFDQRTGDLWVAQNGEERWEQAYLVQRGGNYGWSVQEGSFPFYLEQQAGPGPILPPTVEHAHYEARSLTGGIVYYGSELPDLQGAYIYGDYATGKIWGVKVEGQKIVWHQELVDAPFAITGFSQGLHGELLVMAYSENSIHKLEPVPPGAPPPQRFPTNLSETGLFTSVKDHQVHPALIPYEVNAQLWSDGAHKERFIALPGENQIELPATKERERNAWKFPEGTVLVKTFGLEWEAGNATSLRRIETRLWTLQQNEWVGYSFEWNAEQTEAFLVEKAGKDVTYAIADAQAPGGVRNQTWHYPSRAECNLCHARVPEYVLGVKTAQLNRDHEYRGAIRNQLETLSQLGIFKTAFTQSPHELPILPDPSDESHPLESRVRAYLHVNCAVCHELEDGNRSGGGGNSIFDVSFWKNSDEMLIVNANPKHGRFDIADAKLVVPGDPHRSILYLRMSRRGQGQMPPLASSLVDERAVQLLREWIQQLEPSHPSPP